MSAKIILNALLTQVGPSDLMRYRPFGHSGIALSALGLRLSAAKLARNLGLAEKLIMGALENGINIYHFDGLDLEFLRRMAAIFSLVDRKLLFISLTPDAPGAPGDIAGYTMPGLKESLRGAIKDSGFDWLDLLTFVQPGVGFMPGDSLRFLKDLKRARMVRNLGATAEVGEIRPLVESGAFNVIQTSFDIDSTWEKRHEIDFAIRHDLCVIGCDFFPEIYRKESDVVPKPARRGFFGGKPANPLAGAGTHAFLHQTPDWTPEELCLGYALSLPSLSCILIEPETPEKLETLAAVPERHLPSSVPAQIEMARFTAHIPKSARN